MPLSTNTTTVSMQLPHYVITDYDFTLQPATPDVHYGPIQFSGDDGIGDICVTSEFGDREAHVLCRAAGYVWGVQRTQASDVMTQGPWGTICADHWTDSEADVVCKQLYNRCNESQQHEELSQCGSQRLTTSQCEGTDAAGVFCFSDMLTYSLQGGDSANYGLVYVSNSSDNTAPALLHADLSPDLYDVLCRSLGYTGGFRNTTGIVQFLQDGVWSEMCSSNLTQTTADVICRDILTSPTASAMILNVSNAYFERRRHMVRQI
nr:hypothetical protein BaRGS_013421 [Batillaria attramentaria]